MVCHRAFAAVRWSDNKRLALRRGPIRISPGPPGTGMSPRSEVRPRNRGHRCERRRQPVLQFELIFSLICGNVGLKASSGGGQDHFANHARRPLSNCRPESAALVVQASSSATRLAVPAPFEDVTPERGKGRRLTARLTAGCRRSPLRNSGYAGSSRLCQVQPGCGAVDRAGFRDCYKRIDVLQVHKPGAYSDMIIRKCKVLSRQRLNRRTQADRTRSQTSSLEPTGAQHREHGVARQREDDIDRVLPRPRARFCRRCVRSGR